MLGGAWFQEAYGAPEEATEELLLSVATDAVQRQLGVTATPCWSRVKLHWVGQRRRVDKRSGVFSHAGQSEEVVTSKEEKPQRTFSVSPARNRCRT